MKSKNYAPGIKIYALVLALAMTLPAVNAQTITTDKFNITFDETHGGVITSFQYKGVEMLTGNGKWGAIGLDRSTFTGSGDVCTRWGEDMFYQYDGDYSVKVSKNIMNYIVEIKPKTNHDEVLSSAGITWEISRNIGLITARYKPADRNEYLYLPFIREKDGKTGTLKFSTTFGPSITAGQTEYCESEWIKSSLAQYTLTGGSRDISVMIFKNYLSAYSAYYGADESTWQLHYPIEQKQPIELTFVFN